MELPEKFKILGKPCLMDTAIKRVFAGGFAWKNDIDIHFITDIYNYKVELHVDNIGANGMRIAMTSLQEIKGPILPFNREGEFLCNYLSINITDTQGHPVFVKKPGKENRKEGKYTDIDDGLCLFNYPSNSDNMSLAVSTINAEENLLDESIEYLVFKIIRRRSTGEDLETLRKHLDEIYPYGRFSKENSDSYGYFHTIKEVK